jgi:hypothetical protein
MRQLKMCRRDEATTFIAHGRACAVGHVIVGNLIFYRFFISVVLDFYIYIYIEYINHHYQFLKHFSLSSTHLSLSPLFFFTQHFHSSLNTVPRAKATHIKMSTGAIVSR